MPGNSVAARCEVMDEELTRIVPDGTEVSPVAAGLRLAEGPVWHDGAGALFFTEILESRIWRWRPGGDPEVLTDDSRRANGMALGPSGELIVAGWTARCIWSLHVDGSGTRHELVTEITGLRINTPNDVIVDPDGGIIWTDPAGGLLVPGMAGPDVQQYLPYSGVLRRGPDGAVRCLVDDMAAPNGLCLSPDASTLYVDDTKRGHVRAFTVAADGSVGDGRVFYRLTGSEPGAADGMVTDCDGNVYVSGPGGIHVVNATGGLLGRIFIETRVTNMTWGGDDRRWLYVTCFGGVQRLHLGVPGFTHAAAGAPA